MLDMWALFIAVAMVVLFGLSRITQLSKEGAPWPERLTFGVWLCNLVFILMYPLSGMELGVWPFALAGLAFCLWVAVRSFYAKMEAFPVGPYRGSVLHKS